MALTMTRTRTQTTLTKLAMLVANIHGEHSHRWSSTTPPNAPRTATRCARRAVRRVTVSSMRSSSPAIAASSLRRHVLLSGANRSNGCAEVTGPATSKRHVRKACRFSFRVVAPGEMETTPPSQRLALIFAVVSNSAICAPNPRRRRTCLPPTSNTSPGGTCVLRPSLYMRAKRPGTAETPSLARTTGTRTSSGLTGMGLPESVDGLARARTPTPNRTRVP